VPASTRSRDHIERIAARAVWRPRVVLVVGAGPIGLPAALLAVQRGLEVHRLDRCDHRPQAGPGRRPGASYHTGTVTEVLPRADVILECTGVGRLVLDAVAKAGPDDVKVVLDLAA
jgi:2-polyprenyl-6-methoxyphenol hydroxylase-like FAD-dependent oxidoreductase